MSDLENISDIQFHGGEVNFVVKCDCGYRGHDIDKVILERFVTFKCRDCEKVYTRKYELKVEFTDKTKSH